MIIPNRIVKSALTTNLGNKDGSVSEQLVRHYMEMAQGGSGLVMVENAYIDNIASQGTPCQLSISSEEDIPGLTLLSGSIKDKGVRAGIQLNHCGRQNLLCRTKVKAASDVTMPYLYEKQGIRAVPEAMTITEIAGVIDAFGQAAGRAKAAGFDLVEIQGANGFLITNFLSPHTNKRTDIYGETLENRMRLAVEVLHSVRENVGTDFPVIFRLNGTDYEPDGFALEDTIELCRILEKAGVDGLHISGGDLEKIIHLFSPESMPAGHNLWAAEAVKKAVNVPAIVTGSINTPELAEEILMSDKADFVGLGRPLIADAEWIVKLQKGKREQIRPCIRCNDGCVERTLYLFHPISCSVDAKLGRETAGEKMGLLSAKKIAVIGGGPAGLNAALECAERGYEVTLFEKDKLGGTLNEAAKPWFKQDIRKYLDYLLYRVSNSKVKIISEEADLAVIRDGQYDVVLAAAGNENCRSIMVEGREMEGRSVREAYREGAKLGKRLIIIGAGKIGVELALWLDDQDVEVVVTEFQNETLWNCSVSDKMALGEKLADSNVKVLTKAKLHWQEENRLSIENPKERLEVTADMVIIAQECRTMNELAQKLKTIPNLQIWEIGGYLQPGGIYEAVHSAYKAVGLVKE